MNIFASDSSPIISAQNLDDKRLGKMIIESAQLLCDAADHYYVSRFINTEDKPLYTLSKAHKNHPCALWAKKSIDNFSWLIEHYLALSKEWEYRNEKGHGASIFSPSFRLLEVYFKESYNHPTEFVNAARNKSKNLDFTNVTDTHEAYRLYLTERWKTDVRMPMWTKRGRPNWI